MLHTGMTALTIGGYPPAFFNGQIDEFRIWNVARTAAQIAATMGKTLAGNEANLVGYWKFDETSGRPPPTRSRPPATPRTPGTLMANNTGNLPIPRGLDRADQLPVAVAERRDIRLVRLREHFARPAALSWGGRRRRPAAEQNSNGFQEAHVTLAAAAGKPCHIETSDERVKKETRLKNMHKGRRWQVTYTELVAVPQPQRRITRR